MHTDSALLTRNAYLTQMPREASRLCIKEDQSDKFQTNPMGGWKVALGGGRLDSSSRYATLPFFNLHSPISFGLTHVHAVPADA